MPGGSPRTCSGKAPNPGACPSPARRPGTSAATPPSSTPARNQRHRCSTPCGIIAGHRCPTTTSPGSSASTPLPPGPGAPTSRPGSTLICCATHGLSVPHLRPEAPRNPGRAASCLTSIRYSVRHVRQGRYQGLSLFAAAFDLTWLTCLSSGNGRLPGTLRFPVQITFACTMVSAGVPLVEVAQVLRHHSLQSTAIYARVDLDRLRLLA